MEIELWGFKERVPGLIFEQADDEVCIEQELTTSSKLNNHGQVVIPKDQCKKIAEWLLKYSDEP
jgi:hypothetical protein